MSTDTETVKVPAGPFRSTMWNMSRCGIITPETQLQAGLRITETQDEPRRLFFGEQTNPESMKRFAELQLAGIATEVEVSGYFKYQTNIYKETYLDDSALFVEELTVLS